MISPVTSPSTSVPESQPRDIAGAARQFEALLLTQLLKSACDPQTMTGGDPDAGSCTAIEMAQEQFASALASQGGLGLARMISKSVRPAD
jgi:Rod binding domain-containing protein